MSRVTAASIRVAARLMATDADIARMFGLSDRELERWRGEIEQTRAASMAYLKYQRMQAQARNAKRSKTE